MQTQLAAGSAPRCGPSQRSQTPERLRVSGFFPAILGSYGLEPWPAELPGLNTSRSSAGSITPHSAHLVSFTLPGAVPVCTHCCTWICREARQEENGPGSQREGQEGARGGGAKS